MGNSFPVILSYNHRLAKTPSYITKYILKMLSKLQVLIKVTDCLPVTLEMPTRQ